MLLRSGPGSKSKTQKMSSAPSWPFTFFAGDDHSEEGTLALIHTMKPPVALQKTAEFLGVLCLRSARQ